MIKKKKKRKEKAALSIEEGMAQEMTPFEGTVFFYGNGGGER
jgi:hypothetical protein